jgi:predicted SnoaL-like aldol condensation-catalyzing enzyme
MSRKDIAISFLQDAATGKVDAAYSKVAPNFRHHNPYFPGDAESLKAGMAQAAAMFPNTTLVVKHVMVDGELVAVHSHVQHAANTLPIAAVHMFRFEGDAIAELWDVAMEGTQDSPNENGMF